MLKRSIRRKLFWCNYFKTKWTVLRFVDTHFIRTILYLYKCICAWLWAHTCVLAWRVRVLKMLFSKNLLRNMELNICFVCCLMFVKCTTNIVRKCETVWGEAPLDKYLPSLILIHNFNFTSYIFLLLENVCRIGYQSTFKLNKLKGKNCVL